MVKKIGCDDDEWTSLAGDPHLGLLHKSRRWVEHNLPVAASSPRSTYTLGLFMVHAEMGKAFKKKRYTRIKSITDADKPAEAS